MDRFTAAYITAALWSSTDDNGNPLDGLDAELAPETLARMEAVCAKFQAENGELFTVENCSYTGCSVEEYAGHDFWLTRNGHGVGFWDGYWIDPAATRLTDAAHAFGEIDLYVGDDGLIYA